MADDEFADPSADPEPADVYVEDEATRNESVPKVSYEIASFGWDPDVEALVGKLRKGEIKIPQFQRSYVWNLSEASRFIESLLLGLPVPGILLAEEPDTRKRLVVDGQQRLKTLQFFYDGRFNPKPDEKSHRNFSLQRVQESFEGKTYETLEDRDRRRLDQSIIPATIVRQLAPANDDTSIYHIFERLNSGGRRLTPQEIRVAIYHGPLIAALRELNTHKDWREIFGEPNKRLKDQELILRFLALYYEGRGYLSPMSDFLNKFANRHKQPDPEFLTEASGQFKKVVTLVFEAIGRRAFRPERALNAAVYDSVMIGLARRLEISGNPDPAAVKRAYELLIKDEDYLEQVSRATANEASLKTRIELASAAFRGT